MSAGVTLLLCHADEVSYDAEYFATPLSLDNRR